MVPLDLRGLGRLRAGRGQLAIGNRPDARDTPTGANEQSCRSQGNESHEQRVLDQILTPIVLPQSDQH